MEGSTKELITGLCAALPFMQGVKLQADLARICDNSKVTDHHAILPTAEFVKTGFSSLAESEKKLMTLVCAKLLCAVAAPYEYEAVTAVFTCGGYTLSLIHISWRYARSKVQGAAEKHYPTMSIEELCALPVKEIADKMCIRDMGLSLFL